VLIWVAGAISGFFKSRASLVAENHCGPRGIRINAISPGLIETDMTRARIATSAWFQGQMTKMTPLGGNGRPEDIAGAAAFLFSDDAAFISGQVLVVDGGWLATRYREGPPSG
jgi:3-oxoacyl-[acyl-carrier protein] reductase